MSDPVDEHAREWEAMFQVIAHELEADIARERADIAMRAARWARFRRVLFLAVCVVVIVWGVALLT